MIAARRRRIGARLRGVPARLRRWSRQVDRAGNRALERAYPVLLHARHRSLRAARGSAAWLGPRLRPVLASVPGPAVQHVVEGGDHSFAVPRSSKDAVLGSVADVIVAWARVS